MVPIENVYAQIAKFAAEAGADRVIMFGSRAKLTNRPKSDIDIAVQGCGNFDRLEQRLQNDLWSLLRLDVIDLDGPVSPQLRQEIERTGKTLYERGDMRA